jgi:streptomycin 6-kinase
VIVPADLAATVATWAGEPGRAWLAALPRLVAELAEEWSLEVGAAFQPSGYTSLALPATRAGEPCVLKLRFPDEHSAHEAAGLRHFGGTAAVALLAEDPERAALLLERALPGTPLTAEPDDVATRVVAETLRELWSPPAPEHAFPLLREDAAPRWAAQLALPVVDARLRDEAREALAWLARPAGDEVVLHCDLHAGNVLRATRRPWLAIDPKPVVGDPAFDLSPVLRDRPAPDLVARRFAIVTEVTGLDQARVRGWALVNTVEAAAWSYDVGDVASGDSCVAAATLIAALPGGG